MAGDDGGRDERLLRAADLFSRASGLLDRRTKHERSVGERQSLERELWAFMDSHPDHPWNRDPEADGGIDDPFATGEPLFGHLAGMMHGELRDAADGAPGKKGRSGAVKRLALFALCRSGQVLSEGYDADAVPAALDAALADAAEALEYIELVRAGYAHPDELRERQAEARAARSEGARKGAAARWRREHEAGYYAEVIRRAAELKAQHPRWTANRIGREIQEALYEFRLKAGLEVDEDDNTLELALQQYIRRHWDEVEALRRRLDEGDNTVPPRPEPPMKS